MGSTYEIDLKIDIARNSTDPQICAEALFWVGLHLKARSITAWSS